MASLKDELDALREMNGRVRVKDPAEIDTFDVSCKVYLLCLAVDQWRNCCGHTRYAHRAYKPGTDDVTNGVHR